VWVSAVMISDSALHVCLYDSSTLMMIRAHIICSVWTLNLRDPWHLLMMEISWHGKHDSLNFSVKSSISINKKTTALTLNPNNIIPSFQMKSRSEKQMTIKNLKYDENKLNLFLRRHWQASITSSLLLDHK
jgi:hypothetical protein